MERTATDLIEDAADVRSTTEEFGLLLRERIAFIVECVACDSGSFLPRLHDLSHLIAFGRNMGRTQAFPLRLNDIAWLDAALREIVEQFAGEERARRARATLLLLLRGTGVEERALLGDAPSAAML